MAEAAIHPILAEMLKLGCSQTQVAVAFQVYVDLVDAHFFWDVRHEHNKKLNLIYLTAKKTRSGHAEVFVPISAKAKLSMEDIHVLQDELSHSTVSIAAKSGDSTASLYRISKGLVRPESPDATTRRKHRNKRRKKVALALARRKTDILAESQSAEKQRVL